MFASAYIDRRGIFYDAFRGLSEEKHWRAATNLIARYANADVWNPSKGFLAGRLGALN